MSATETVIFVYDAGGKLVAEYSTNPSQTPQVQYLTNDHLGTPRINTNENGAVVSRTDYMPYGEEIIGLGGRSTTDKYVGDDVRQGFTGYINDEETGLDYAQARMYKKELGRFTGVDPVLFVSERQMDPQQINLYGYCRNNPLGFTDPTGMILDPTKWDESAQKAYQNYVDFLNSDKTKYAAELATLEQLKKSDVNYVIQLDQNGTDYSNGKEGGVTTNGTDVFINVANQGNGNEKFSLNSTIAHEVEHARQFDSGEWGFASDSKGRFVDSKGKFVGRYVGVDITDEVKAWSVTAKLSNNRDQFVMGGQVAPELQFRVIDTFNKATSDSDKAAVLARMADNYKNMSQTDAGFPSLKGQSVGTLIRPTSNISVKDQSGNSIRLFGRIR